MRMLRMMSGVTLKDRIRNDYVRGSLGVESIRDVLARNRLRWYGHMVRKPEDDVVAKVWRKDWGKKFGRGRPEQTWDAVVKKDMDGRVGYKKTVPLYRDGCVACEQLAFNRINHLFSEF